MALFRRRSADSLDPQYLLEQAQAAEPAASPGTGFRLTVEDVFTIRGRGTVVTGRIESGTISKDATVRQTRPDGSTSRVRVGGIEMFRKVVDTAGAGDNVGLLLPDLDRGEVARGDVLSE